MNIYEQPTEQQITDKLMSKECESVTQVHADGSRTRYSVIDGKVQSTTTPRPIRKLFI